MSNIEGRNPRRGFSAIRKFAITTLAAGAATVAIVVGIPAAGLLLPRVPTSIAALKFDGFVPLPAGSDRGLVSVLDYMTVRGRDLYVASIKPGAVFKVPLFAGRRVPSAKQISVMRGPPSAHGVVFDARTNAGFVSRSDANTVDMFDPETMKILKRIPVEPDVDGIFYDSADRLVYAASGDPKVATIIDAALGTVVGRVNLSGKPEFAVFDPRARLFYQNLTDTDHMAVVDPIAHTVTAEWYLDHCSGPSGMAFDQRRNRALIACSGNAVLVVFDLNTHTVIATLPIGAGPDSVAYDAVAGRIYTTGRAGILSVIDEKTDGRYRKVGDIALAYGAHTLAVDPVTHRVYVGYVGLLRDSRLAVFSIAR